MVCGVAILAANSIDAWWAPAAALAVSSLPVGEGVSRFGPAGAFDDADPAAPAPETVTTTPIDDTTSATDETAITAQRGTRITRKRTRGCQPVKVGFATTAAGDVGPSDACRSRSSMRTLDELSRGALPVALPAQSETVRADLSARTACKLAERQMTHS